MRAPGPVSIYEQMAERAGRFANHRAQLEALVVLLMEPAGHRARQRAAEAVKRSRAIRSARCSAS